MKLNDIVDGALELTEISFSNAEKLQRNDIVKMNGEFVYILESIKRNKQGKYLIKYKKRDGVVALIEVKQGQNKQLKNPIGKRDKNNMVKNIKFNVKEHKNNVDKLRSMVYSYYTNFTEINNYEDKVVKELMKLFPKKIVAEFYQLLEERKNVNK